MFIGIVREMEEQPAGTGGINGRERHAQMMKDVKNTGRAQIVMVSWESAGRTRK